jgi:hypothetical protein
MEKLFLVQKPEALLHSAGNYFNLVRVFLLTA